MIFVVSARDVEAKKLIANLAEELKTKIKMPEWAVYVKTGTQSQRPPEQKDWWYIRAASILRKIYTDGPVGTSRLRSHYGGRKQRGHKPEHFRKGSGKIIRVILQDLEKINLISKDSKGRKVTKEGQKLLDNIAKK